MNIQRSRHGGGTMGGQGIQRRMGNGQERGMMHATGQGQGMCHTQEA